MIDFFKNKRWAKVVERSGIFDKSYYLFTYPDVREKDIDPVLHYLKFGAKEGRNPSATFDTNYYLASNPDVNINKINPLLHFILYGREEGRGCSSSRKYLRNDCRGRSCVFLHVYYLEDLSKILRKLKNIKQFDLFLTCRKEIEEKVRNILFSENLLEAKIFVIENIGYDIYPFFYLIKKVNVNKYKYFLKMHTKRGDANLDIKSRNNIWFDMLTDPILGNVGIVEDVHNVLNNPQVFLVGSADMYRSNQTHMYGNKKIIDEIFSDYIGIDKVASYDWGFIAGSIFWFSQDAAKAIKSYGITEKFVKNKKHTSALQSGISSSIWHGFERIFGWLATGHRKSIYLSYVDSVEKNKVTIKDSLSTNVKNGILLSEKYSISCYANIVRDYTSIRKSGLFDESFYRRVSGVTNRTDPIYHYLRYGFFEHFDPNINFSSDMYLAVHEDVKGKFINPFVHYVLYGIKEGRKTNVSILVGKDFTEERIDILATCWIGAQDPLLKIFINLNKELTRRSLCFEMVCSNHEVINSLKKSGVESCTFCTSAISSSSRFKQCEQNFSLAKLYAADSAWIKSRADLNKVSYSYAYWKDYLVIHQVKHVLIWGNTAPMSQLFIMLCQEMDVEYTIIERGHFGGTIVTDVIGQLGFGVKQKQLENNKVSFLSDTYKNKRMQEIVAWVNNEVGASYAEKNQKNTAETKNILQRGNNKKIVLFLGANDLGSGMKDLASKPRPNTWFKSTQDALDRLVQVLPGRFDDVLLVVKPHPAAQLEVSSELPDQNYIFASDTSVIELIKISDVCVTTISSVLGYCIALGKPTLQFGITDSTNSNEIYDVWHPSVIPSYLRDALGEQFFIENNKSYSEYILDLFDSHLIGVSEDIPTRLGVKDFAAHLFDRAYKGTNTYDCDVINSSSVVSEELYSDILSRSRKYYDLSFINDISLKDIPKMAVVIPVYDDLEGLIRCVEHVVTYRDENNSYDVVLVWDSGPRDDVLNYCRYASKKYGIDLIENKINIGFSGTVNKGILKYKRHDIILLNSDTVVHSDWAVRMQKAAYIDKAIASVNPLSNNATLNNVPFPNGTPFPKDVVRFVESVDTVAKNELKVAVEAPVSHGFCVFLKRCTIDIVGLFDECKFGKGHGEDNEYSMRVRSKGFKCVTSANVYVGHDGSTSFKEDAEPWKIKGRQVMNDEFPFYMAEIKNFFNNDPLEKERKHLESHYANFFK